MSRCFRGIRFFVGGKSCPDVPRCPSCLDGEKRISIVHRYLVLRWGVDIVFGDSRGIPFSVRKGGNLTQCPRGIIFSVEGGHRVSMSPRYPSFLREWGTVS